MAKLSPNTHLSGSVLPAFMGYSPFKTPQEVLVEAMAARDGIEPDPIDSLQIAIGNATEDVILARGLRMIGLDPDRIYNHENGTAAKKHPALDLWYSDDGLIKVDEPLTIRHQPEQGINVMTESGQIDLSGLGVLEAKFTTVFERADDPPLYRGPIQLQAGMMCHDANFGVLITCYGARKLVVHIFPPHETTRAAITNAVHEFERHISAGTFPEPKSADEAAIAFSEPAEDDTICLPEGVIPAIDSYLTAKRVIDEYTREKMAAELEIMRYLANSTKGEVYHPDLGTTYKVRWPVRHSKAKPAVCCPNCTYELHPAKPESSARQKTISIKEEQH